MCVHECAEVSLGHPGTGSICCVLASIISIGSPRPDVPRVRQGAEGERESTGRPTAGQMLRDQAAATHQGQERQYGDKPLHV